MFFIEFHIVKISLIMDLDFFNSADQWGCGKKTDTQKEIFGTTSFFGTQFSCQKFVGFFFSNLSFVLTSRGGWLHVYFIREIRSTGNCTTKWTYHSLSFNLPRTFVFEVMYYFFAPSTGRWNFIWKFSFLRWSFQKLVSPVTRDCY